MPKVVPSFNRRLRAQLHSSQAEQSPVNRSSILLSAPRKVSFEDGHQSSSSFSSSSQVIGSSSSSSLASSSASSLSKSSLRRKAPSVCLVGLASDDAQQDCLSPMPQSEADSGCHTAPSSPWGHFVDILVPLDEEDHQQPQDTCLIGHKRRLGEAPPLFGGFSSSSSDDDEDDSYRPTFQPRKHKHRRCWTAPSAHPYGLLPRHRNRRRARSTTSRQQQQSFLPGFFLEGPSPLDRMTESSETKEVETALERMKV